MKKIFLAFVLVCSIMVSQIPAMAYVEDIVDSGTLGDNITWSRDGNGNLRINGTGEMKGFYSNNDVRWGGSISAIKNIYISDGITSIGRKAFYQCESVEHVEFPESLTNIDQDAFGYCKSLTYIEIPDSVTNIGHFAFGGCENLTGVKLPLSLTNIGSLAFAWNTKITKIELYDDITFVDADAFKGCTGLTGIYVGSESPSYSSYDKVLYSKDTTKLICYPAGKAGESYIIPPDVKEIERYAFYGCVNLQNVVIPDGVGCIDYWTFYGCDNLKSITIPDTVKWIGMYGLGSCSSLSDIYYSGTKDMWDDVFINKHNESVNNAVIHYKTLGADSYIDPETDIRVKVYGDLEGQELDFMVDKLKPSDTKAKDLSPNAVVYDIYFMKDGERINAEGQFEVSLPVPKGMDESTCKVYYIDDKGNKTDMNAKVVNGYLVFTTDHFSLYAVDGEKAVGAYLPGDVNDDGAVNAQDKAILNRYLAGWDGYKAKILNWDAADINVDTKVDAKDKAILNRYLAGWTGYDQYFK